MKWFIHILVLSMVPVLISICNLAPSPPATSLPTSKPATPTSTPQLAISTLTILPEQETSSQFISIRTGGDADTIPVSVGKTANAGLQSVNGPALNVSDGNTTRDSFMQFNIQTRIERGGL